MKKIVIPTDFSDNALDALTYAIQLFEDIPCTFYILNTYYTGASRMSNAMRRGRDSPRYHFLIEESENGLKKISTYLKTHLLNDKHTYKMLSKSAEFIPYLKHIVAVENIDLIVMGTTGATGAKEIFMGSNAVKVIKHIDFCPILSVPKTHKYQELEKVVFSTDYKKSFNAMELNCLIELQLLNNFMLKVIHIKREKKLDLFQEQNKRVLQQIFDSNLILFEEIDTNTTVEVAINTYVKKQDVNMICLLNYEHSFMEKLLHEPIIKRISFHSLKPLLIIPV